MVTKNETPEEKANREMIESIATNLQNLADSVKALLNGKLNKKALLILLAHSSKVPQYQVDNVLTSIQNLSKDWLNK